MPFVSIRISGSATKDQKSGIVADITQSLVLRLGKNPAAVQIVIDVVSTVIYGGGGQLVVDRDSPKTTPAQEDAHAEPSR